MKYITLFFICIATIPWISCQNQSPAQVQGKEAKLKALIIDGENNHGVWPKTTMMMKDFLEQTGLFDVEIARTAFTWQGGAYDQIAGVDDIKDLLTMYPLTTGQPTTVVDEPVPDPDFSPDFKQYDVVISNMGWRASDWPKATKKKFEQYMAEGGGFVVVHAANNPWGDWPAFNEMIGLGGWGGRNTESGPYVYYDEDGQLHRDTSAGDCGSHGQQYEFIIQTRAPEHPIMAGLPSSWLHSKDELYDRLRGPAKNMTVLATAYSDVEKNGQPWNKKVNGTGRHEPLLITINYGEGRVFHTGLGHMDYSMECVGFITTLQRGTEWAATGKVTQKVPDDFPNADVISTRKWQH